MSRRLMVGTYAVNSTMMPDDAFVCQGGWLLCKLGIIGSDKGTLNDVDGKTGVAMFDEFIDNDL